MRAHTQEQKSERRSAILAAALDEFFESGFAAARMDTVAARARVSKGTLYLYFKSKEDVLRALHEAVAAPDMARARELAATAPTATLALRAVIGMAPALLCATPMVKLLKIMVAEAPAFPELAKHYRTGIVEPAVGVVEDILRRGIESGEFRDIEPVVAARLVFAPLTYAATWMALFGRSDTSALDLDRLFEAHADMVLRALARGGSDPEPPARPR
jgi:AcrR family transcriptional regulator